MRDPAGGLTDFMETAAAMTAMDLVISVDTAAAHVAGALGRPTFPALPYSSSFRWPLRGRDYPRTDHAAVHSEYARRLARSRARAAAELADLASRLHTS